ncbi:hypothetical protein PLESTB_000604400 [Pleodorina starrii]|uniref:UspA domain-containing protein n=1 Tax=Pleodorina starrii TaxID=330485 RepID=A0A9W6BHL7_9CHLO|nr:hypothetical protein PLESTB_000604400 [Pleodorina starrii]
MINNIYRDGDEVHLLNVISRLSFAATLGVPAVDFTPQINREAYEAAVRKSEAFISETDTNSVGHVICTKAEELKAACVLMGSHNKGPVAEFFMGSVSQYVSHHCKMPVVIVKQP